MSSKMPLSIKSSLATPAVECTGEPYLLYTLFEFHGKPEKSALPVNIALIIDVSKSMHVRLITNQQFSQLARGGQAHEVITDGVPAYQVSSVSDDLIRGSPRRLDYVSKAMRIFGEYLRPSDHFSVTAFADQAVDLIPSSPGSQRALLQKASRQLEYLNLGDGTNMASGIASAFAQIQTTNQTPCARRLILLTDGHTRRVDECYAWARRAQEVGLPLTTLGVGAEFNEDLLIPLADMTGGNAYYIEIPDQIPSAFRKELGVAYRISLQDLQLRLQLQEGVHLRRIYRVTPELGIFDRITSSGDQHQLFLGDYDPSSPTALLVEFIIPGWGVGSQQVASTHLSWRNPDGEHQETEKPENISIQITEGLAEENQRVVQIIERVAAYRFGMYALQEAQKEKSPDAAPARLRQAARRLHLLGEAALAEQLTTQADLLHRTGTLDASATKKLRYQTRQMIGHLVQ